MLSFGIFLGVFVQLQIESHGNITLESSDGSSKMEMDADSITMQSTQFLIKINNPTNGDTTTSHTLLSATEGGGIQLGSGSLKLNGSLVDESITTKEILGLSDDGLLIEGSRIDVVGGESIQLIAENGPIDMIATGNITLSSKSGQVRKHCCTTAALYCSIQICAYMYFILEPIRILIYCH